jgi:hypothetical protein
MACSIRISARALFMMTLVSDELTMKTWNKKFWGKLITYFTLIRHGPHRKRFLQQFFHSVCIRCRCNVFTKPLPSNDKGDTDKWEGFMKYAVEMGSGAIIYIPSFIKISSIIRRLIGEEIHRRRDTQKAWWSHKPTFISLKIRKVG